MNIKEISGAMSITEQLIKSPLSPPNQTLHYPFMSIFITFCNRIDRNHTINLIDITFICNYSLGR